MATEVLSPAPLVGQSRASRIKYFILPLSLLAFGLALSAIATLEFRRLSEARDQVRFERSVELTMNALRDRLEKQIELLRGTAAFMKTTPEASRRMFKVFVDRLHSDQTYSGAQGIGFARRFGPAERAAVSERLSLEYARPIDLRPEGERAEHTAILYLEPLDRRNEAAIGFDMFSEPTRRKAMQRARDLGLAALSGKVELVQEIDADKQPGFLIYVPVYTGEDMPGTVDERRARLIGWAYSPFRANDLFHRGLGQTAGANPDLQYRIFDGASAEPQHLLYDSDPDNVRSASHMMARRVEIAGRAWTVVMKTTPAFDADSDRRFAFYVLAGGMLTTLLLAGAALLQGQAARAADIAREDLRDLNAVLETRIERRTEELMRARDALREVNANLEDTVAERTSDLVEANEEIQRFAYIVSHDLRSPLVNIMGFTSELEALRADIFAELAQMRERLSSESAEVAVTEKDAALGKDFDEAIGFIKSSIAKMDRLIGAILRLSREGRREFHPENVDMNQLIGAISETVAHQAEEAGAAMVIEPLPSVRSDRLALEQVFSNLVDNALKYLRKDEPGRIAIKGRETPSHLIYEVVDNGRGIDPKDHQRIFDLFRRAGEQDRPGEGIGLAHVRTLVRRLGGTLTLTSTPGQGSVFTVMLPRRWITERERAAA